MNTYYDYSEIAKFLGCSISGHSPGLQLFDPTTDRFVNLSEPACNLILKAIRKDKNL